MTEYPAQAPSSTAAAVATKRRWRQGVWLGFTILWGILLGIIAFPILYGVLIAAAAGWAIGNRKNRGELGAYLGFYLGLIGILIILGLSRRADPRT